MRKFVILLLLAACSNSSDDYRKEGSALAFSLAKLLEQVESKEEMEQLAPKIESKIEKMTQLMIEARKLELKEGDGLVVISEEATDALRSEMERIYKLQGVEEVMHNLQRNSLHKLDAFDRI